MASVGVRVERPVRLRSGVEGRFSRHGQHFWVLHSVFKYGLMAADEQTHWPLGIDGDTWTVSQLIVEHGWKRIVEVMKQFAPLLVLG
jgi:hypothetical protein